MLVDTATASGPPSILDSPTLARVERARLREEGTATTGRNSPMNMSTCCPSLVSDHGEMQHAIKKGLLWQQRERLFSRWKERYFILTRDYLHCFKRSTGTDKISDMGQFIFKVKLVEVEKVEWINKKSYSTVGITLQNRETRILLRAPVGLEDWFELLEECMMTSKERRRALRKLHNPLWHGDDESAPSLTWLINRGVYDDQQGAMTGTEEAAQPSLECMMTSKERRRALRKLHNPLWHGDDESAPSLTWLINRGTLNKEGHLLSDSVPDLEGQTRDGQDGDDPWPRAQGTPLHQRLSLLTDIDINSCSSNLDTPPPSVPATFRGRPYPYRLNNDVFFMSTGKNDERYNGGSITASYCSSRSALTPVGSFRSSHLFSPAKTPAPNSSQVKYRDRSQSDALNWKSRTTELKNRRCSYLQDATHV